MDLEIRPVTEDEAEAFGRADLPSAVAALKRYGHGEIYSLNSLFRDEQRRLLARLLAGTVSETEAAGLAKHLVDPRYAAGVTQCSCGREGSGCAEELIDIDVVTATARRRAH